MEWYLYLAVIGTGFVAGFLNTVAGSGSMLTLPLLMFLGLPANVANGTNRIAILLQNIVGAGSFRQQKIFRFSEGIWLAIPAVIGSIIGAGIAVRFNEDIMRKVIAGLLLAMCLLVVFKPEKWIGGQAGLVQARPTLFQLLVFFFIGMYGGFIQAGVGFFLLAGLVLGTGVNLLKANALKVFIILAYTPFALAVFMINRQVDYKLGLVLAIGNMLGAFVGSRVAVSRGPGFLRIILLVALLFSSLELFGVFDLLQN